ncbi:MAG: 50S ribosomal protein L21 [Candidatus Gracilibacteria bacterium]|nr:50S ribosomal protein L21 [Candidatus Gracilibacteria bacterium]
MFAIIEIGGQQFKVEKGTKFEVGQLSEKEGSTIDINTVLLVNNDDKIVIGKPFVQGAFASAKILEHKKDKKITVFKMKAKKRYRRTKGHRQSITVLEVLEIKETGGKTPEKIEGNTTVFPSPKSSMATKKALEEITKKFAKAPSVKPTRKKKSLEKKETTKKPTVKKAVEKKAATKKPVAKKTTKKEV